RGCRTRSGCSGTWCSREAALPGLQRLDSHRASTGVEPQRVPAFAQLAREVSAPDLTADAKRQVRPYAVAGSVDREIHRRVQADLDPAARGLESPAHRVASREARLDASA